MAINFLYEIKKNYTFILIIYTKKLKFIHMIKNYTIDEKLYNR